MDPASAPSEPVSAQAPAPAPPPEALLAERLAGCLIGCAMGDALGLPFEGLSPARTARRIARVGLDRYSLLGSSGFVSDDTELHAIAAAAANETAGDPDETPLAFAGHFRRWLMGMPVGIGWATLRANLRMWAGWGPDRSGVNSAGNGPATRAAALGVAYGHDRPKLLDLTATMSAATHRDPRAIHGAQVVALAAWHAFETGGAPDGAAFLRVIDTSIADFDGLFRDRLGDAVARRSATTAALVESWDLPSGAGGFVVETVPAAIHAWFHAPGNFREAMASVIAAAGDTDSTAAIAGSLVGAGTGEAGLPPELYDGLWAWPWSVRRLRRLAAALAKTVTAGRPMGDIGFPVLSQIPRNGLMAVVVIAHGIGRLLRLV